MVCFCGTDEMLNLFKMVCRRYWRLYPGLIEFEILTYQEMFASEQDSSREVPGQEAAETEELVKSNPTERDLIRAGPGAETD